MKLNQKFVTQPEPKKKKLRVQIGEVGVDSGQLLICDPCYIGSSWKKNKNVPLQLGDVYVDKAGVKHGCQMHNPKGADNYFLHFGDPQKEFDGKTPNELIAEGEWTQLPRPEPSGEFSYAGCCEGTMSDMSAVQLKYKAGHDGAGVAFASGYGDGVYPVYATYNEDGRIVKIEIKMD